MIKEFKSLKEACAYLENTQNDKILFDKYLKIFYRGSEVGIIIYCLRNDNSKIYDFHPIILDDFDIYGYSNWRGVKNHIEKLGIDLGKCVFKLFSKE